MVDSTKPTIADIKGESIKGRIGVFFKQKLFIILLSVGSLFFMFRDAIKWKISDEEFWVIICSMVITYFFTIYTVTIMGKMGMKAGKDSDVFKGTMNYYATQKDACKEIRSSLGIYCKMRTTEEHRNTQEAILDPECLDINKLYDYTKEELTKEQWKVVRKARKVKVVRLHEKDLVSERGANRRNRFSTYLGKSEHEFTIQHDLMNLLTKAIFPVVLTYIGVESFVFGNILAGIIKTTVIIFGGILNYLVYEDFAMNELRNRFINKADSLADFKNLYEKNPEIFTGNTRTE